MTYSRHALCFLFWLILAIPEPAKAHCDASPDLSAPTIEFESLHASRIEALLRFGERYNLCFGIEYVDATLLTESTDLHIPGTTIQNAIKSILGQRRVLTTEVHNGVIEISRKTSESSAKNIFHYVIPRFEARRGTVQEMSIALHIQLVADLNPQIGGFAGQYPTGDLKDQVGPFTESNRTVKSLLDEIVRQSKGGAWITRVSWKLRTDFTIPKKRRIWTIVENGVPNQGYTELLRGIAAELASGSRNQIE
jgi:hypothetical protein